MDCKEALEYIHGISWTFCKPGLDRIEALCESLGHPERSLRFVHVAGTNGKGSFCSMLSEALMAAGYRVGLFTSPYIYEFNERMRVDGQNIPDEKLAEITEYVKPHAEKMKDKPTEFELISALAFEYFKRERCDVVVLEAGMGGRLDSTNVIRDPYLSVITGIALDHTAFLGDTLEKIAAEKAGIIKDGAPLLFGGENASAREVIRSAAAARGSAYYEADYSLLDVKRADGQGSVFSYREREELRISLLGLYQPKNAALVTDAVDILRTRGLDIPEQALREGLKNARWRARFEVISREPTVIFDGAHNPQGIDVAVESIKHYYKDSPVAVLTGVLADKDHRYIASRIAEVASRAFTITPSNPRALSAEDFAAELSTAGVPSEATEGVSDALERGMKYAAEHNCPLCCLGSLYTYVEVIDAMNRLKKL